MLTLQIAVGFGHGQWESYLVDTEDGFDAVQDMGDIDLTDMVKDQLPENAVVSFAKVIYYDEHEDEHVHDENCRHLVGGVWSCGFDDQH